MITVVIPAYNATATLPACLSALQRQSQPADEIIVVDDGSRDDTAGVVLRLDAVLARQAHQGPAAARNLGIQAARGEIVLFTDADCEPAPDWVEQMVKPLADSAVSGVKGVYRTRQRETVARLVQCEFSERYDLLDRSPSIDFVDTHAAAFRTSALRQVGGFDPGLTGNEDVDLSYRLAQAGYLLVFNRQAVVYHLHPATWSRYLRLKVTRGYWRMMVYGLHPGKALRDSYTPQLLKVQVLLAFIGIAAAAGAPIWPALGWVAAGCLVSLLTSAIPFSRRVARSEPDLTGWAFFFVVLRALALSIGSAAGLVGMLTFRLGSNRPKVEGER
jgi:glycosyltransferase involved in cell wall biosynthesis